MLGVGTGLLIYWVLWRRFQRNAPVGPPADQV